MNLLNLFIYDFFLRLTTLQLRQLEGSLCRVPNQFYNLVWDVLTRTPCGINIQGHLLPATPTLTTMSRSELSFSLLVEETLHHIREPERRQVSVECLCIVATILSRNPELRFQHPLDLDQLMDDAYMMYCKDHNIEPKDPKDISQLFALGYRETTGYLARAAVNIVLQGGALSHQHEDEDITEETCKVS